MPHDTFGGYLPLNLQQADEHYYPRARRYCSARAALYHLLCGVKPERIWLPRYICQSVIDAVTASGVGIAWYSLDERFLPRSWPVLNANELFYYVNYFGQCTAQQEALLKRYASDSMIFDHAQAFYAPHLPSLATLWSPRKFFGLPDGGLLMTALTLTPMSGKDVGSVQHAQHLLLQHASGTRAGYQAFQQAEQRLHDIAALSMSALTEKLMLNVNYQQVCLQREQNYQRLHQALQDINQFPLAETMVEGPFCYPLLLKGISLHSALIAQGVFVATYWAEVRDRVEFESHEVELVDNLVAIPCDQRYSAHDIDRLISIIVRVIREQST
ncbi:hypothetical protein [Pseudomonas cerasi]